MRGEKILQKKQAISGGKKGEPTFHHQKIAPGVMTQYPDGFIRHFGQRRLSVRSFVSLQIILHMLGVK